MNDPTELPKRAQEHVVADEAVKLVKSVIPKEWIIRDQPVSDYGIDLEIELAGSVVTGRIFKGRVKGHRAVGWTADGIFLQPVMRRTQNYWQQFSVPIVLFVVDVSRGEVYWARTQDPGRPGGMSGVRVHRSDALPLTISGLTWYVVNWIDRQAARQALYSVALLSQRLEPSLSIWMRQ